MKTTEDKVTVSALTDLVKINNDRIEGYNKAAEQAKENPELRMLFQDKARDSKKFVSELNTHLQKFGEDSTDKPTVPGEIFRGWMSVKDTFKPSDKTSILESCEFGEDAAIKAYDMALKNEELDSEVKNKIQQHRAIIKESHNQIKAKRDASKNNK